MKRTPMILLVMATLLVGFTVVSASGERPIKRGQDSDPAASMPVKIGSIAPDFTLKGMAGIERSLAEFEGKVIVLEWVDFDCESVRQQYESGQIPDLQSKCRGEGVIWFSICSSAPGKGGCYEGKELRLKIAEHKSAACDYLIDSDGKVGRAYGVGTTPHAFVIDAGGTVIYSGAVVSNSRTGSEDADDTEDYVQMALKAVSDGKPVTISQTSPMGCNVNY